MLAQRGTQVINPFSVELMKGMANDPAMHEAFLEMTRRTFRTDVVLTGCNAVTEDGKVVSIDGVGNRVAATIFGAPHVIITVGRNKIVKDVHEAIDRIKNVIAPEHAKRKGRRTPCVVTGRCTDCDSIQRMCNVTMIIEKKPLFTRLSILLIDEDLGLGWDPAWNEDRIGEIRAHYYAHTWAHALPKSS